MRPHVQGNAGPQAVSSDLTNAQWTMLEPLIPAAHTQHGGRPRAVDTSRHFCPHPTCAYHGWVGFGNIRANGHPSGGRWRQLYCLKCQGYFQETRGTLRCEA